MTQLCAHRNLYCQVDQSSQYLQLSTKWKKTPKEGHYNVMLYDKVNELYFSLDDMNITTHSSIPKNTNKTHYIAVYLKSE